MSLGAEGPGSPLTIRITKRNITAPTCVEMTTGAFRWVKGYGQLLMRVVQAATLAHAVVTWYDATKHKPLSKATLSKATTVSAAWGSLHSANLNDTPMIKVDWSCLSSYFR